MPRFNAHTIIGFWCGSDVLITAFPIRLATYANKEFARYIGGELYMIANFLIENANTGVVFRPCHILFLQDLDKA